MLILELMMFFDMVDFLSFLNDNSAAIQTITAALQTITASILVIITYFNFKGFYRQTNSDISLTPDYLEKPPYLSEKQINRLKQDSEIVLAPLGKHTSFFLRYFVKNELQGDGSIDAPTLFIYSGKEYITHLASDNATSYRGNNQYSKTSIFVSGGEGRYIEDKYSLYGISEEEFEQVKKIRMSSTNLNFKLFYIDDKGKRRWIEIPPYKIQEK